MSNDNTIKTYSAVDIEKYHNGQLSAREMHAMEKAALDDPFLADALEGYAVPGVNAAADIAELKKRLEERTSKNRVIPIATANKPSFPWLRAAAMFVLVAGAALLVYKFGFNDNTKDNIAKANSPVVTEKKDEKPSADKTVVTTADSAYKSEVGQSSNYTIPGQDIEIAKGSIQKEPDADKDGKSDLFDQTPVTQDSLVINNQVVATAPSKPANNDNATSFKYTIPPASKTETDKTLDYYRKQATNKKNPLRSDSTAFKESKDFYANADKMNDTKERRDGLAKQKTTQRNADNETEAMASPVNVFRGRVTDANNNALPFANITNTVDNVGTYSDSRGNFTLISPDSVLNVQVRSVGFENNTRQLESGPRDNQIVMQDDNRSLNEVVVGNSRNANMNRSRNNTIVHEEPEPVDGWSNYDIYVANNIKMPDTLRSQPSRRGEVELSFDVSKNGEPINITIDKSLCESCDKEAIRLLKQGPKWKQKSKRKKRTSVTISF